MQTDYVLDGRACSGAFAGKRLLVHREPQVSETGFNGAPYTVQVEGRPELKSGPHVYLGEALAELRHKAGPEKL